MSQCCGSAEPSDPHPLLAGVVLAITTTLAGVTLWRGESRSVVLWSASATPAASTAASFVAPDVWGVALPAIAAWGAMWALTRLASARAWLGSGTPGDQRHRT